MIEPWFQEYVLLAFRIDKALRTRAAQSPFVDYYYGPPAWKALIDQEPVLQAIRLVRDGKLAESSDKNERGESGVRRLSPKKDGPKVRHDFHCLLYYIIMDNFFVEKM